MNNMNHMKRMMTLNELLTSLNMRLTQSMARNGVVLLRISLGIVFFWFGFLKFFPGLSPAQDLAARTIHLLTFGLLSDPIALFMLAVWECAIGLGLIFGIFLRPTLFLLWLQMLGTITPMFFFAHETFTQLPYAPTLEGQYIIKNIVLISAGVVIGATGHGNGVVVEPDDYHLINR